MASTIRIKKRAAGSSAGAPSSLASSELAFNENTSDKKLYYGYGDNGSGVATSIIPIGGPGAFCDLTTDQTVAGDKTFSENVVVTGNLTVNGTTSTLATTNSVIKDTLIELGNGVSGTPSNDAGLVVERGSSDNAFIGWDESADKFKLGTGSFTGASTGDLTITTGTLVSNLEGTVTGTATGLAGTPDVTVGVVTAGSLDISGNADIDGTLEADAYTVNGTALDTHIAGVTVTNATTAATGTQVTVSANNSTDETVYPVFVDGATGAQGIESDTGFTYNPSSGLLTIAGELDAGSLDVSGNADIDGTCEADAYTVNGTALNEYIADTIGAMVGSNTESGITVAYEDGDNTLDFTVATLNQDTTGTATNATNAVHVSVADNESTNENDLIPFIEDASATGNVGLESDGDFHYNPSTGTVTATYFAGTVDGGTW